MDFYFFFGERQIWLWIFYIIFLIHSNFDLFIHSFIQWWFDYIDCWKVNFHLIFFLFFFFLLLLMILWLLLLSMMITAMIMLFRIQIKHHHHVSWQKKNPNKSKWIKFIPSFIHCGCCEFSISRKKNENENEKNFLKILNRLSIFFFHYHHCHNDDFFQH